MTVRWLAVAVSTLVYLGLLWFAIPPDPCTGASECVIQTPTLLFVAAPLTVFWLVVVPSRDRKFWGILGGGLFLLLSAFAAAVVLDLSAYWPFYTGLSVPLVASLSTRSRRVGEAVARGLVALGTLALLWGWVMDEQTSNLWKEASISAALLVHPFVGMELASVVFTRVHRRLHSGTGDLHQPRAHEE